MKKKFTFSLVFVLLFAATGLVADEGRGGILTSEMELADDVLENTSSLELWRIFDLGESVYMDGSILSEFSTADQLFGVSPAATLVLADTVRLGSEFFFDYFVDEDELEVSQSFHLGLYGQRGPFRGDLRGKVWTDFVDQYELSPRARGFITIEEDGLGVEIGQALEWAYFYDDSDEYSEDVVKADSSVKISLAEGLRPYLLGELRHEWFQSEHDTATWSQEWTYSNSLFIEAGLSPEERDFTGYASVEIPLFSEEDSSTDPVFGLGVRVNLF